MAKTEESMSTVIDGLPDEQSESAASSGSDKDIDIKDSSEGYNPDATAVEKRAVHAEAGNAIALL